MGRYQHTPLATQTHGIDLHKHMGRYQHTPLAIHKHMASTYTNTWDAISIPLQLHKHMTSIYTNTWHPPTQTHGIHLHKHMGCHHQSLYMASTYTNTWDVIITPCTRCSPTQTHGYSPKQTHEKSSPAPCIRHSSTQTMGCHHHPLYKAFTYTNTWNVTMCGGGCNYEKHSDNALDTYLLIELIHASLLYKTHVGEAISVQNGCLSPVTLQWFHCSIAEHSSPHSFTRVVCLKDVMLHRCHVL